MVSRYGAKAWAWQAGVLLTLAGGWAALGLQLGWPLLLVSLGCVVALVALGLVTWFYRDPERAIAARPDQALAPADGEVTDVAVVDEPRYFQGPALRVGIFLSPLDVHVNRAPLAGVVEAVDRRPGKSLRAFDPAAIEHNSAVLLGARRADGLRWAVRQVTGAMARTIVCEPRPGDRLEAGQRYGMIQLGSRTELLLPPEAEAAVQPGERVQAGLSVLASLPGQLTPATPELAPGEASA